MTEILEQARLDGAFTYDQALDLLRKMLLTRTFEENAEELYGLGKVHGTMHLSIGQEAVAAGASSAVKRTDYLLNVHRGHGHFICRGGDLNRMMAEFMGKEAGYCRGRGGSMHIADLDDNNLGANGIVGGNLPIAVGVGLSIKLRKTDQVALTLFGDGAINEGAFHESANMAAIWDLPVVYLCENNQYGMSMAIRKSTRNKKLSDRAAAYGMPGETVDGNDVVAVHRAIAKAAERARQGKGPSLVEAVTYRWRGHSKSDRQAYRTREEVKQWMEKDPIPRFAGLLGVDDARLEELRQEARLQIKAAVAFAEACPEPDVNTILEGVYA